MVPPEGRVNLSETDCHRLVTQRGNCRAPKKELEPGATGNQYPRNAELVSQVPGPPKGRAATTRLGSQPLMRPRERLVFFHLGVKMQKQGQKEIATM